MKTKLFLKILLIFAAAVLLLKLTTVLLIEPWLGKKVSSEFSLKVKDYLLTLEKVHFSVFTSAIEFENIVIVTHPENTSAGKLNVKVAKVKFKGIHLLKYLLTKEVEIGEIDIKGTNVMGELLFPKKGGPPIVSKSDIRVQTILFDQINLDVKNTVNFRDYSIQQGILKVSGLQIFKQDTLSVKMINHLDFQASQLSSVSADSMYSFSTVGPVYSSDQMTLQADQVFIHPNFDDYPFTARHKFQTDRIEAMFETVTLHHFSFADFIKSGDLISSFIEIGTMEMKVFRDNRKSFHHINKLPFQEMIYNYRGAINIDSIALSGGNITYAEHAPLANEAGRISFEKITARIYKVSNDSVFKHEKGYLELYARALLMGKGTLNIHLKGRIYDHQNTFSLIGALGPMAVGALNPMLEKNAFIYATSGNIESMNFNLSANNNKAKGTMTLLYHGLDIAVKNKQTDDTTAIKERVTSLLANLKLLNSNPGRNETVRVGTIDKERDPERFLFNYCFKSILSGIKSSLIHTPKRKQVNQDRK